MVTAGAQRRALEKERRREQIVDAALALIGERGWDEVTYGDVAQRAGLSRPLVYFYFPERECLFLTAVDVAYQRKLRRFEAAVASRPDGLGQLESIGRSYVAFAEEDPAAFATMSAYGASPAPGEPPSPAVAAARESLAARKDALMGLLIATVERAKADGSVRTDLGDSLPVALCLWAFTSGLVHVAGQASCPLEEFGVKRGAFLDLAFRLLNAGLRSPTT